MAMAKRKWNWFKNEDEGSYSSRSAMTPWRGVVPSFSHLQKDIEQLYDNAFRSFGWPLANAFPGLRTMMNPTAFQSMMFQPRIDIASTNEEYTISMEVPGMDERDIRLDISPDGVLTVSGEKRQEADDKSKDYECVERSFGFFQRSLTLPDDVDQEAIEANFRNGVLTIMCPRNEAIGSQRRPIPIGGRGVMEGREHRGEPPHRGEGRPAPSGEQARNAGVGPKKAA